MIFHSVKTRTAAAFGPPFPFSASNGKHPSDCVCVAFSMPQLEIAAKRSKICAVPAESAKPSPPFLKICMGGGIGSPSGASYGGRWVRGASGGTDPAARYVARRGVLQGPDIWCDPKVQSVFFLSDRLVQALTAAKMRRYFHLIPCDVANWASTDPQTKDIEKGALWPMTGLIRARRRSLVFRFTTSFVSAALPPPSAERRDLRLELPVVDGREVLHECSNGGSHDRR